MTNPDYTHFAVLLDRSGSIQRILADMQGGFGSFLGDQAAQPGKATISLYQFDDEFDTVAVFTSLTDPRITGYRIAPRGSTALLGALGTVIDQTGAALALMPEEERPERVVVFTASDGLENWSHRSEWSAQYTKDVIREKVKRQQDDYNWQFVFIGTNFDAIEEGAKMGVSTASTLNFGPDSTLAAFGVTSDAVTRYRSGVSGQSVSYTPDERKKVQ
jgi:hypothetical protein